MNNEQIKTKEQLANIAEKGYTDNFDLGILSISKTYESMLKITDDISLIQKVILQSSYSKDPLFKELMDGLIIK